MADNPYKIIGAAFMTLLQEAKRPGADFASINRKVDNVDYGLLFPDFLPVSNAKFAVKQCLGPRKIHDGQYIGNALSAISSCEIAGSQYFERDGSLRPEYAHLKR